MKKTAERESSSTRDAEHNKSLNNYIIRRKLEKEINARKEAERIIDQKNLELYLAKISLMEYSMKLEKTDKELDRFVYITSHDLRSPISSILGLINLLQMDGSDQDMRSYMEMMRKSLLGLDDIIKNIVNYSFNKRNEIRREKIDINKMLDDVLKSLRGIEGADKIQFNTDILEEDTFYSDPGRIRILFDNLVSNAIKYHKLQQQNPYINIEVKISSGKALFIISDNGRGIAEEQLPRVFDMFYRASEDSKGSGLGLYVIREIVSRMNGKICIDSKPGVGSKFTIEMAA